MEGDNYMLPQQVVKVLLKLVGAMQSGDAALLKDHKSLHKNLMLRERRLAK